MIASSLRFAAVPARRSRWTPILLLAALLAPGCAAKHFKKLEPGELKGTLNVEWMAPDRFLYKPDPNDPLRFTRADKTVIVPEKMPTDGGSIPRPLQAFKHFSPWGYGPAFIIHDWLFRMQDCGIGNWQDWTIDEAALVMSEVMRTLTEKPGFNFGSEMSVYLMYKAVRSAPAQRAWKDKNCKDLESVAGDDWRPTHTFTISFPD